jgi:hypothetical protein
MMLVSRMTPAVLATVGVLAGSLMFTASPALAAAPSVGGEGVAFVSAFEARLESGVNAGEEAAGKTTECDLQYGKASVAEHVVACEQAKIEGGEQGVGVTIKGLEKETPYHYQFVLKNATSEATGAKEAFTTGTPEKPGLEGEGSSAVTSTTATLEAQINPDSQKTAYKFEYATNEALTGAKTAAGASELEGYGGHAASVALTGLKAGETYYYRVVATDATGTSTDETIQSFATLPTPFTDTPENVSGTGATFKGHLTLGSAATQYSFDYNVGSECTGGSSTPTVEVKSATPNVAETWSVPSAENSELGWPSAPPLYPNKEYTVCFVTSNAYGSQVGSPVHFMTPPAPPTIDSEAATGMGAAGLVLEAKINPNLQETGYFFEYATEEALLGTPGATKIAGEKPLPAELKELPANVRIPTPELGKTYYYRVVAENESTTIEEASATGEIKSFALPVLTTGEAQGITRTTATLSGTVNPEGSETSYYFAYISEAGFQEALKKGAANPNEGEAAYQAALARGAANPYAEGETTAPLSSSSDEPQAVAPTLASGLLPGTTYQYALVAKNALGLTIGPDKTLTTLPGTPPIVSTGGASGVSQNSATLSGTVGTNSLQTEYGFEIETEPGEHYGPATGLGSIGGATTEEVHVTLSKLQPGTTYYYRVEATNADGTEKGQPETFTTPGFPTLLTPQSSPPLIATPNIAFPKEEKVTTGTTVKTLTNKEKLAKALKACGKKPKSKRAGCERLARRKYGAVKKRTRA